MVKSLGTHINTGKVKELAGVRQALSEKVFCYLWGVAKNYIMYWGVTSVIIRKMKQKCSQK